MAKFFRCWVIVAGGQPTAFRAREADELIPTLRQLQRTQPDVTLMWFERGRFWPSPEAARQAQLTRQHSSDGRGPDWRPGGNHKDPKARPNIPRDVKRARFKKRLIADRIRDSGAPPSRPPSRDDDRKPWDWRRGPKSGTTAGRPATDGHRRPKPGPSSRPPGSASSGSGRPKGPWTSSRPPGGRPSRGPSSRPPGPKGPSSGRPPGRSRPPRRRNDK